MKRVIYLTAIIIPFLSSCATTPTHQARMIRDADHQSVSSCQFVGNVSGTSGWGGVAASTGIDNAKNEARNQASEWDATHIEWVSVTGGFTPHVSGNAYKC